METIKSKSQSENVDHLVQGIEQIYDQLKNIFDTYGLKTINDTGIDFNYNIHEVMMRLIDDNQPEDTVVQILQRGYEREGQVIRPAKVIVTQHTPPPPPPKEEKKEEKGEKKEEEGDKDTKNTESSKENVEPETPQTPFE